MRTNRAAGLKGQSRHAFSHSCLKEKRQMIYNWTHNLRTQTDFRLNKQNAKICLRSLTTKVSNNLFTSESQFQIHSIISLCKLSRTKRTTWNLIWMVSTGIVDLIYINPDWVTLIDSRSLDWLWAVDSNITPFFVSLRAKLARKNNTNVLDSINEALPDSPLYWETKSLHEQ